MKKQKIEDMISAITKAYGDIVIKIKTTPGADNWDVVIKPAGSYTGVGGDGKTINAAMRKVFRLFCEDAAIRAKRLEKDLKAAKTLASTLKEEK